MSDRNDQVSHRLEHWVHWTLLAGLAVSAALLIAGLVAGFATGTAPTPGHRVEPGELTRTASSGRLSTLLLDLGLLALMATPVLRVIALAAGWTITGQFRFALVALSVLGLLGLGLLLGFG
jgi:hypothetical protein